MSYLFDTVMNESYVHGPEVNISDHIELNRYCDECITDFYKTEALMYKLETNNICALIEAKSVNDIDRINELNYVMEGFFGNLFQSIVKFVKKVITAIINFFKKIFSFSDSSSGGGSSTRSDGTPIVEKEKNGDGTEKTTLHITIYPIENVAKKIEDLINESTDNVIKIGNAILDKSEFLYNMQGTTNNDINYSIDKFFSNKFDYLTKEPAEYNKIASEFVTKDPMYKNADVEQDKFDLHYSIDTYKNYVSKKVENTKKSLFTYMTTSSKIMDLLSNRVDKDIKKINDQGAVNYINKKQEEEDRLEEEYLRNKEKEENKYPLRAGLKIESASYTESFYYSFDDFLAVMEEITVHGSSIRGKRNDLSGVLRDSIKICRTIIVRSTHMIKSGNVQLGSIADKDIKQYIHIYNTINKK